MRPLEEESDCLVSVSREISDKVGVTLFENGQEHGIDLVVTNRLKGGGGLFYVQATFSAGKTRLSSDIVVDNFVNALLYHGDLVNALLENRFCFVIMSYQVAAKKTPAEWCHLVQRKIQNLCSKERAGEEVQKKQPRTVRQQTIERMRDVLGGVTVDMLKKSLIVMQRPRIKLLLTHALCSR